MPYTYRFDADGTEARWSDKDGVIITGPDELGFREFVSRELTMYLPPHEQPADPQGAPPGAIVEPIASTRRVASDWDLGEALALFWKSFSTVEGSWAEE